MAKPNIDSIARFIRREDREIGQAHTAARMPTGMEFRHAAETPPELFSPGDDLFTFATEADGNIASYDGGAGNDTLEAVFFQTGIEVSTEFTENPDGSFTATYSSNMNSVTVTDVENIDISTPSSFVSDGQTFFIARNDYIRTGFGDDTIDASFGDDIVDAGAGTDIADGGGGADGIKKLFPNAVGDIVWNLTADTYSGPGDFTAFEYFIELRTGSGDDTIVTTGAVGNVSTVENVGDDVIFTRGGNDVVTLFDGQDTVDLGDGNDRLVLDYTIAQFTGDTVMTLNGNGSYSGRFAGNQGGAFSVDFTGVEHFTIDTQNGFNQADNIVTGKGDDIISAYTGNDTIRVGAGVDRVDGGVGIDGLAKEFGVSSQAININLFANTYAGPGSYANLEYFVDLRTGNGADTIVTAKVTGDSNSLGDDVIFTRGGNDVVTLFDGQDTVDLGDGNDRLVLDYTIAQFTGDTVMTLNGNGSYSGSFAGNQGGAFSVNFTGVEHFTIDTQNGFNQADNIVTGKGNDIISTYTGNDTVSSGAGDDYVDGGVSNDSITAGAGADTLVGGASGDFLNGGSGRDWASYATATAAVRADLNAPASNTGDAAGDSYASIENLIGGGFADTLVGNGAANYLAGGAGADMLDGGNGIDWADYSGANRRITADLQIPANNTQEALGDSYVSIENLRGGDLADNLRGDGDANRLDGGVRNDRLSGRAGDDTLVGGQGFDQLAGQQGVDSFLLASTDPVDYDRIVDFARNETILLDGSAFGLAPGALDPDAFVLGNGAQDSEDRLIYLESVGKLFFDPDGAGGVSRELIAIITNRPELDASDFLVI